MSIAQHPLNCVLCGERTAMVKNTHCAVCVSTRTFVEANPLLVQLKKAIDKRQVSDWIDYHQYRKYSHAELLTHQHNNAGGDGLCWCGAWKTGRW